MIDRIEIENFYSIRDKQVIDLRIAANAPALPRRFVPSFVGSKERVPAVMAIFGANASGKSTVLKALAFLAWFARDSFQLQPQAVIPCERFNDAESLTRPIRLAAEFGGPMTLTDSPNGDDVQGTYRYELEIGLVNGQTRRVTHEALRQRPNGRGKWVRVFERHAGHQVHAGKAFALTGFSAVIDKVRENASLISTLAQFDHRPSLRLREAAMGVVANILIDRAEVPDKDLVHLYASNPETLGALNREIERIDLGIRRMTISQGTDGPNAMFEHQGLGQPMPWLLESHGTRSFIRYFPLIAFALAKGGIAVVDEIDVSIHPLVLPEIVRWFHDPERNLHGAQLWMTCHNVSMLEELEKEEIFFCEKDEKGRTHIFGLQDIQAVRRLDNRYRKYLSGVYGAIPKVG